MTGFIKTAVNILGEDAIKEAIVIKAGRISILIPILGFLIWWAKEKENKKPVFFRIPWFVYGFVIMGLMASYLPLKSIFGLLKSISGFLWTIALTSIGLLCNFKQIINVGGLAIVLGFLLWIASIFIFFLANFIFS